MLTPVDKSAWRRLRPNNRAGALLPWAAARASRQLGWIYEEVWCQPAVCFGCALSSLPNTKAFVGLPTTPNGAAPPPSHPLTAMLLHLPAGGMSFVIIAKALGVQKAADAAPEPVPAAAGKKQK